MTGEEIKRRLDELARKYVDTHDKEIVPELYRLARALEKMNIQRRLRQRAAGHWYEAHC
jgi:FKBP-type peptidyl-prolyl cis-trans isomerase (trigger factor)